MAYVFLTACRNEQAILPEFLREFTEVVREAGVGSNTVLYVVDDLSTDRSVQVMEEYQRTVGSLPLRILMAPTNLGNQGALFYGLSQIDVGPGDILITFDCDGEDDVRQIPSIIALGKENPEKLVLIERGRRQESLTFRVAFTCYKALFRFLTRQTVVPNNFLLIPGQFVPVLRRTPLAAVHFAYAILKTRFPSVVTHRDRRTRYGGRSSQSLFMVASHGLVGLMVFYETVIAKLLLLLMTFGMFSLGVVGVALALPENLGVQRTLLWSSVAIAGTGAGFFSLLMSSALALIFKMAVFTLSWVGVEGRAGPTLPRPRDAAEPGAVPAGRPGRQAS
jgi:glycosyltransferase involved in cell wall biosynthesis